MKDKLIQLIKQLSNKREFDKLRLSLTINFEKLINEHRSKDMFYDNTEKIIDIINSKEVVSSFNFTLYESDESKTDDYNEERYEQYWFESKLIFHGKKKIKTNFNFLSKGLSISFLEKENKTIEELIEINEFYKSTSQKLHKLLK
jgi:hypothetical protein